MLEKFVATNPTPVADAVEARQRLADYASKAGDGARRDYWYRQIIAADAQAGAQRTERTHYLAAKAQLALAAPARDAFRAVRLTAPLKKSLLVKRRALEAAMDGYKAAADYQVAEVTTAATYDNALLEEQVFPFEEQAIKAHELNAARAKDGIYDEWVRKSFTALAELKPARYGKTELTQDVVAKLE